MKTLFYIVRGFFVIVFGSAVALAMIGVMMFLASFEIMRMAGGDPRVEEEWR